MEKDEPGVKRKIETLLDREADLYREIRALSKKQIELLSADPDEAALDRVVLDKEDRFRKIQKLDREIAGLAGRISSKSKSGGAIEQRVQSIRSLLTEILELEKEGNQRVLQMSKEVQKRISKMQTGKQVIDRYGSGKKFRSPIFVSIKR